MRTSRLGGTAVEVTALGFGGTAVGGMYEANDDVNARATIDAAYDAGIRFFDTAPDYGIGLSERRIGEALRERDRSSYTLSTKVGRYLVEQDPQGRLDRSYAIPATHRREWDWSREGVLRCVDESLTRLGIDRVDMLALHDCENHMDQALTEAWDTLADLKRQGVVGAIGAGLNYVEPMLRIVRELEPDFVLMAGRYSLFEQPALDDLYPECERRGVSVLAGAVYNSGLLANPRPPAGVRYNYAPAPPEILARVNRLADVCEAHGVTLPHAALQFPLAHPAVAGVLVGMRTPDEVRHNVALLDTPVPAALWSDLRAEGLLDERAPVPA